LVTWTSSVALEMPKSVIFTEPLSPSRMLAGLMSRCTMPASWAAANAEAIWLPIRATSSGAIGPCSFMTAARLLDWRYSITSHGASSSSTTSNTVIAFGWCSFAAIRPSRMERALASSASSGDRPGCSSSCLTATVRFSRSSCASHTTPIAPVPMRLPNR
jgi:hypothetical protein